MLEQALVAGFEKFEATNFEDLGDDRRLSTIFNLQRVLMSACEIEKLPPDMAFLVTQLALVDEAMEAATPFKDASKPWKRNLQIDLQYTKEEVVDQLFFVIQGAILLGMDSEELFESYRTKHAKNIERIINKRGAMDAAL